MLHLPLPLENPFWWVRQRGSYYRKNKLGKTFPKAYLWQPLRPASSLLESVLLLLRFKFWHFEINRKQRDFFLYFFIYSFTKTRWKHFNQACRGPDTGDGGDRSVMSGALPGVPLKPRLFSPTSNSANLPTLSTVADYINSPKYVFGEKNTPWKCCSSWFCSVTIIFFLLLELQNILHFTQSTFIESIVTK